MVVRMGKSECRIGGEVFIRIDGKEILWNEFNNIGV
jgi:hypothetical protein